MRRPPARLRGLLAAAVAAWLPLTGGAAEPAAWAIKDAPFRAVLRLRQPPLFPEAGVAIEVPEFGQTQEDLRDVVLTDAQGVSLPVGVVWRGAGDRLLLVAGALAAGKDYFLYFGGGRRTGEFWLPKLGLLMETRRLPLNAGFDSWETMERNWRAVPAADGVGFVDTIYAGENPFGDSLNFMTHYSGYLHTKGLAHLYLYTLSSDASFVLVDDAYQFGWPGQHSPAANADTVPGKEVPCSSEWTKIDYYQAKGGGGGPPAMVLGWERDKRFETVPASEWLHPGTSAVAAIEQAHGEPVPFVSFLVHSYIAYGGYWYYDTQCWAPPEGLQGWSVRWTFDDGETFEGTSCRRVLTGPAPHTVTVTLTRGNEVLRGKRRIAFTGDMRRANVNDSSDVEWYVSLLKGETPSPFGGSSQPDFLFLRDFGDATTLGRFAGTWLKENLSPANPLWIDAEVAHLRYLAQSDPQRALDELHALAPETQRDEAAWLDPLEMELLVFCRRDPGGEFRIRQIALKNAGAPLARVADVRLGDLYRLLGKYKEAAAQYLSIQKRSTDDSESRKLPAQDRAYSITIDDFIQSGHRDAAERKLGEWEFRHPMAKLDTDFLLLRARAWMLFGRWKEALVEIDSFEKMQADSPYEIDAEFYRARVLYETEQKEAARKIWTGLAKNYPKSPLAQRSLQWAAKP